MLKNVSGNRPFKTFQDADDERFFVRVGYDLDYDQMVYSTYFLDGAVMKMVRTYESKAIPEDQIYDRIFLPSKAAILAHIETDK